MGNMNVTYLGNSVDMNTKYKVETEDAEKSRAMVYHNLRECREKRKDLEERRAQIAKTDSRARTCHDLKENSHGLWQDKTGCSCESIAAEPKCSSFLPEGCWGIDRNSESGMRYNNNNNIWFTKAPHLEGRTVANNSIPTAYTVHETEEIDQYLSARIRKQMAEQQERWRAKNPDM
jgi:hypothetical protein